MKPYSSTCVVCGRTRDLATPPQSDTCGRCSSRRNGARSRSPERVPKRAVKPVVKPVVSFETEVAVENAEWLLSMGERVESVAPRVGMNEAYLVRLLADKGIEVTT